MSELDTRKEYNEIKSHSSAKIIHIYKNEEILYIIGSMSQYLKCGLGDEIPIKSTTQNNNLQEEHQTFMLKFIKKKKKKAKNKKNVQWIFFFFYGLHKILVMYKDRDI